MTDVDTSSYSDYSKQPNILQQIGSVASTQNQMNQNRLFQQTLQGRQAYGAALAGNTDPNTGEVDYPGVNKSLAEAGPAAALSLPEASAAALTRQIQQQQLTTAQVEAIQKKHSVIGPDFADLASKSNPTMDDVYSTAANMMANTKGHANPVTIEDIQRELGNIPTNMTSDQIKSWAMQHALRSARIANTDPSQFLPKPTAVSTNTGTVMMDTNPVTNPGAVGSTVQQGIPPTQPLYDPTNKQPIIAGPQPAPQVVPAGGSPLQTGGAPRASQGGGLTARIPTPPPATAFENMTQDQAAAALPQTALTPAPGIKVNGPAPSLATGPALGEEAAETAAGGIAGTDLGKDRISAKNSANTIYNMKQALTQLGQAPTGQGTESLNAIKGFITAYDPTGLAKLSGIADDNKAYDEANKYLTAQAQGLAAAVGPNTNENLSTALTGSPNTHINKLAAEDVQKTLIGLTRMNIARTMAFDQNPQNQAVNYPQFGAQWNKSVDPRAFMADVMPAKQLKPLLDDPKFAATYRQAVAAGLLNHSDVLENIKNGQQQ